MVTQQQMRALAKESELPPRYVRMARNSSVPRAKYPTEGKGQESISLLIGAVRRSGNNGLVMTSGPEEIVHLVRCCFDLVAPAHC